MILVIVFFFLMLVAIIGNWVYFRFCNYVKKNNSQLWNQLGQPDGIISTPTRSIALISFLWTRKYKNYNDSDLQKYSNILLVSEVLMFLGLISIIIDLIFNKTGATLLFGFINNIWHIHN